MKWVSQFSIALALILTIGLFALWIIPPSTGNEIVPTLQQFPSKTPELPPDLIVQQSPTELPVSATDETVLAADEATTTPVPSLISTPQHEVVSNQVVIQFQPDANPAERDAYIASLGGKVTETISVLNTVVVSVPETVTTDTLPASTLVMLSEPDYIASALVDVPTSDPLYGQQWNLSMIGAPDAWAQLPANAPEITVAVIDSGVCLNHPDLAGRILDNGRDFVEKDYEAQDEFGHGCGVAGIIAANIDNGLGIAGAAPNARIMPLRVLDASGLGSYSNVAAAIVYAVDNGAQVINLSLGGSNPSSVLENAINYAAQHDVVVVAAAGNNGGNLPLYPARYANAIAVGSVDANGSPSSFSNHGVDIYAPGRDILSTSLTGSTTTMSGTSFSAPHVAAVAAIDLAFGKELVLDGGIVHISDNSGLHLQDLPTNTPTLTHTPDPTQTPPITPEPTTTSVPEVPFDTVEYQDAFFGFTVLYPVDWHLEPGKLVDPYTPIWETRFVAPDETYKAIFISVQPVETGTSSLGWVASILVGQSQSLKALQANEQVVDVTVAGVRGVQVQNPDAINAVVSTYVVKDGLGYTFSIIDTFNQVPEEADLSLYNYMLTQFQPGNKTPDLVPQEKTDAVSAAVASSFQYPMSSANWTIDFNIHPSVNYGKWSSCLGAYWQDIWHAGEDWGVAANTTVRAVANGQVVWYDSSYNTYPGRVVIVRHDVYDSTVRYSVYSHLGTVSIYQGQTISKNDTIGTILDQGSNSHLHWEIRNFENGSGLCNSGASVIAGPGYTYPDRPTAKGYTDPSNYVASHQGVTDTTPPTGNFTNPSNNASVETSVYLAGTASDNVGVAYVKFTAQWPGQGWHVVHTDYSAPYNYTWDLCASGVPNGQIELGFDIVDTAGNERNSPNGTRIIYKNANCNPPPATTCPGPSLISPANGYTSTSQNVTFSWSALSGCNFNGYTLRIRESSVMDGGANIFDEGVGGTSRTVSIPEQYNNRTLYWGVRAANATDANWSVRSFRVEPNTGTNVTLCTSDDANSGCWNFPVGAWSNLSSSGLNDQIRSIRTVPSNMSVMLFFDEKFTGTAECYNGPRIPLPTGDPWNLRGQVTSVQVFNAPGCPTASLVSVILYEGQNFTNGHYWGMGNETGVHVINSGDTYKHDRAESIRIPSGKSVIVYDNADGASGNGAKSACLTGAVGTLGSLNNKVSSIEIFNNTTCTRPDNTPPTGQITSPGNNSYQNGQVTITASASDDISGVNRVEFYAWSTEAWSNQQWVHLLTDANPPYSLTWDVSGKPEGGVYVSANIVDNAGNSSGLLWDPNWRFFIIDKTPPTSQVDPLASSYTTTQFSVTWAGSDNFTQSELLFYDVQYQVNCTGSWLNWISLDNWGGSTFNGEAGTSYCFRSRARDLAGNIEAWPANADTMTTVYAPPANDAFTSAVDVANLPYGVVQDVHGATVSENDPTTCVAGYTDSLWFTYTAPGNHTVTLNTEGSNYDTVLAVYTGSEGSLNAVACDDDSGTGTLSALEFDAVSGITYHIMVAKWGATPASMSHSLILSISPPLVWVTDVRTADGAGLGMAQGIEPQGQPADDQVTANAEQTNFNAGDSVTLYILATNLMGTAQPAYFRWQVTDPLGNEVPSMQWQGTLSTDVGGWYWSMGATIPATALTGEYVFTGEIYHDSKFSSRSMTFNVTGMDAVYALSAYTTDSYGTASLAVSPHVTSSDVAASAYKSDFNIGEPIQLHLDAYNNNLAPVMVSYQWQVFDPFGDHVPALEWAGDLSTDPGKIEWLLPATLPDSLITGYYTFTASLTYNGVTESESAVFHVQGIDPPTNDNFNNARLISGLTFQESITTRAATVANDDPAVAECGLNAGLGTVWYRYTPPTNTTIMVNTIGSDYDTVLAIWTGTRGNLSSVACNDDLTPGVYQQSRLAAKLTAGRTYYIEVSTFNGGLNPSALSTKASGDVDVLAVGGQLQITVESYPGGLNLIENGGFDPGTQNWYFGGDTLNVLYEGMLYIYHLASPTDASIVYQDVPYPAPKNGVVNLSVDIGNIDSTAKEVLLTLYDVNLPDSALTCAFTLQAESTVRTYALRGPVSANWANMHVQVEVTPADGDADIALDNFTLTYQPTLTTSQVECVMPPFKPVLETPADDNTAERTTPITASWFSVASATGYYAELWGGPGVNINSGWKSGSQWAVGTLWGGTYEWRVKARNNHSEGDWSETRTFTVKYGSPSNFTGQALSASEITLTWSPSPDAPGNIDGYRVYRDDVLIDSVGNAAQSFADTGLSCSTSYDYRIVAYKGTSESNPVTVSAISGLCPPVTPDNLQITVLERNSITLSWTDNAADESAYYVEHSTDGINWTRFTPPLPTDSTSFTHNGLVCGTDHYYRVYAFRQFDLSYSEPSNVVHDTTVACPVLVKPDTPTQGATTRTTVDVAWNNTFSDEASVISIERSLNGTDWQILANLPPNAERFSDTMLICGTAYQYRIRVYREEDHNYSPYSDAAIITTNDCPAAVTNTMGLYKDGVWMFRDSNDSGVMDVHFMFGPQQPGWTPLIGDWDGDGVDGIGLYKDGTWIFRNSSDNGPLDKVIYFTMPGSGWLPVVGDWNGDDIDTPALYKEGTVAIKNTVMSGSADARYIYGPQESGWLPIAGDWNGSGTDTISFYKAGQWIIYNGFINTSYATRFNYGPAEAGWIPLAGDWDQNLSDTIGLYRAGNWRLRNRNSAGVVDLGFTFGTQAAGWQPIASYRGAAGALTVMSMAPINPLSEPIGNPTAEPTQDTPVPTLTDQPEMTPEPTLPPATPELSATDEPEVTPEVTPPLATAEPQEAGDGSPTPEPTVEPAEVAPTPLPETTDEPGGE